MNPPLTRWISNSILSDSEEDLDGIFFEITLASLFGGSKEVMMGRTIT